MTKYEIQESTVHLIFECYFYYKYNTKFDSELADKLDFFDDLKKFNYLFIELNLYKYVDCQKFSLLNLIDKLSLWLAKKTNTDVNKLFKDNIASFKNIIKHCYQLYTNLIRDNLTADDILKIHELYGRVEYENVNIIFDTIGD